MKKKVTSKERRQAKQLRVYTVRTATQRQRKLYNPFNKLADKIEERFIKANEDDIKEFVAKEIDRTFKPMFQGAILSVWELNINQFTDYFVDKFKRNINVDTIQTIKSSLLKEFSNKYMAKKVTNISDTLEQILNNRIDKYAEAGLSARDIARNIVKDTKGEIKLSRAKLIAREETSQVISKVNFTTAEKSGLKYKKWIHAGGGKTDRINHLAMDGVVVKINEKFNVPGTKNCPPVKLDVPKDPDSTVACQIISCFCTCNFLNKP